MGQVGEENGAMKAEQDEEMGGTSDLEDVQFENVWFDTGFFAIYSMHGGVLIFAVVLLATYFELEKRLLYNICNGIGTILL